MLLSAITYVWIFMTLTWLVSLWKKDVSIVDIIFSLNYLLIHLAYLPHNPLTPISLTVLITSSLWAIRLATHLYLKNKGSNEDKRYQRFRQQFGAKRYWWFSYFQVFLLQGAFLLIFASPIILSYQTLPLINYPLATLGLLLFTFGFLYEAISDYQMYRFKKHAKPNELLTTGLWRYSRHPNYFGELTLWFGLATLTASSLPLLLIPFVYIGPLFQTYVMTQLSGAKNHEPHMFSEKPDFKAYTENTPTYIPNFFKK